MEDKVDEILYSNINKENKWINDQDHKHPKTLGYGQESKPSHPWDIEQTEISTKNTRD